MHTSKVQWKFKYTRSDKNNVLENKHVRQPCAPHKPMKETQKTEIPFNTREKI